MNLGSPKGDLFSDYAHHNYVLRKRSRIFQKKRVREEEEDLSAVYSDKALIIRACPD